MKFKLSVFCATEGLSIPIGTSTAKILRTHDTTDAEIAAAEENFGFKFGAQTKEFFKKYAGLHINASEYFSDIKSAISKTLSVWKYDDRLSNKSIDKVFIAADGMGNYLCVDSSDTVYWYYHDSNPAFDTQYTKGMKLFKYIEWEYKFYNSIYEKPFAIVPGVSVGDIKFGMKRSTVRETLDTIYRSNKTDDLSDNFDYCKVYYNKKEEVIAVSLSDKCKVIYKGKSIMNMRKDDIYTFLLNDDATIVNKYKARLVSKKLSLSIGFTDGKASSVLAGNKNYFSISVEGFALAKHKEISMESLNGNNSEIEFTTKMKVGNNQHKVKFTIYNPANCDASKLGNNIINFVCNLDKQYSSIIKMCNEWITGYIDKEGGPKEAPLSNTSPIDASKQFQIYSIWIWDNAQEAVGYLDNKSYKYDVVVWFTNYNDDDRGFDAHFLNGKLVFVEMAP